MQGWCKIDLIDFLNYFDLSLSALLEKVAINDALPLKAARPYAIAKLKSFWDSESELQTLLFLLDSPFMSLKVCAMDWGRNKMERVGKTSVQF